MNEDFLKDLERSFAESGTPAVKAYKSDEYGQVVVIGWIGGAVSFCRQVEESPVQHSMVTVSAEAMAAADEVRKEVAAKGKWRTQHFEFKGGEWSHIETPEGAAEGGAPKARRGRGKGRKK